MTRVIRRGIRADRVISVVGDTVLSPGLVEIEGSKIVDVRRASDLPSEPDLEVDDWGDATILPGFVDAHAHVSLAGDGRTYEAMAADSDEMMVLVGVENLRRHLSCGVTTIRDNGGRNRVPFIIREGIERGYISGPRLLVSGRPITMTGGHFHWCNGVADGPEEIRAAIRALVAEGADHIKIMASGGGTKGIAPYLSSYSVAELREAVQVAQSLGRLTTAHARATSSISNALEAGLDCIEHADFVEAPSVATGSDAAYDIVYDPKLGGKLVASRAFVSFTLQSGGYHTLVKLRALSAGAGLSSEDVRLRDQLEARFSKKLAVFSALLNEGLEPRLAVSSDAGPFVTSFGYFHYGLELAVEAGMTPIQALRAGTLIPAQACGLSESIGSLEPGKVADLVVVPGNPVQDISATREVLAVYLGGQLVSPMVPLLPAERGPVLERR